MRRVHACLSVSLSLSLLPCFPTTTSAQDFCVTASPALPLGGSSYWAEIVDVDGDGNPDIVAGVNGAPGGVQSFLGDGAGTFTPGSLVTVGSGLISITGFHADADGNLDLAVADTVDDRIHVLHGDGAGGFTVGTPLMGCNDPYCVATADMNADGIEDVLSANRFGHDITLWLGSGGGTFGAASHFAAGSEPSGISIADLNLDGDLDCVVTNRGSNDLWVFRGDGAGGLAMATTYSTGAGPIGLDVGDFDVDGLPDVAVANHSANTISLFRGTGSMALTAIGTLDTEQQPEVLALIDLDGDGLLDIAVENSKSDSISLYHGHGDGTFGPRQDESTGTRPHGLDAADLDHDGLADVVVANLDSQDVWVHGSDPCPLEISSVTPTSAYSPGIVSVVGKNLQHVTSAIIQQKPAAIVSQGATYLDLQPLPSDPAFAADLMLDSVAGPQSDTVELWPSLQTSSTGIAGVVCVELQLGAPGLWALAMGTHLLPAPVPIPPCWYGLLLDPSGLLVIVEAGAFPSAEAVDLCYPVPNDPALAGVVLHLQAWTSEAYFAPYEPCSFTNAASVEF